VARRAKNGYLYDQSALQSIAQMLEGAHAYADHARSSVDERARGSVRDIVGFYHDAESDPAPIRRGLPGASMPLYISSRPPIGLWSLIQEACALGRPELVGLFNRYPRQMAAEIRRAGQAREVNPRPLAQLLRYRDATRARAAAFAASYIIKPAANTPHQRRPLPTRQTFIVQYSRKEK